jgi:hypothetical protein
MTIALPSRPLARRLVPLATVAATEHRQPRPSALRAECPTCEKTFVESAIVNGPIVRDPATLEFHRARWLYCDHCHQLVHIIDACKADGTPLGKFITKPAIYKSKARIDRFLREHPEAAGVAQSV